MKRILSFLLVVLLLSAAPVYACTGVYVGKEVSAEGTTLIGRSEDQGSGVCNKMFFVQPASSQSGRELVDTGMYQHGFSVPLPDKTYKYTAKDYGIGEKITFKTYLGFDWLEEKILGEAK